MWPLVLFTIVTDYCQNLPITCYVFGGLSRKKPVLSCHRFVNGTWLKNGIPVMPTWREKCAVAHINGYIYIIGGRDSNEQILSTVDRLHLTTLKWSRVQNLPEQRAHHRCVTLNDEIYCFGGIKKSCGGECHDVMYRYNTKHDTWTTLTEHSGWSKYFHVSCKVGSWKSFLVWNNQILGFDGNEVARYDIDENKWTRFTLSLELPLGFNGSEMARYDDDENKWTSDPHQPRYSARVLVVQDKILFLGGRNRYERLPTGVTYYHSVDEWCPVTNKCRRLKWMLPERLENFAAWYDPQTKLMYIALETKDFFWTSEPTSVWSCLFTNKDDNDMVQPWKLIQKSYPRDNYGWIVV
jgi:hypothetical protein